MSDSKKPISTFQDLKRLMENADVESKNESISGPNAVPSTEKDRGAEPTPEPSHELDARLSRIDKENLQFLKAKIADAELREREAANFAIRLKRMASQQTKTQAQIDERMDKLGAAEAALHTGQANLRADQERLADVAAEERRVEQMVKAFKARGEKLERAEAAIKKRQAAAIRLRADLRAALEDNDTLSRELRSANRKVSKLTREAKAHAESQRAAEHAGMLAEWMLEHASSEHPPPWSAAVVVGSGPLDETDFWNFLIDRGIDAFEPNTEDVPVMIVGRDGWTEEQLEMQIAARQGDTLKVYSQEMALVVLAAGSDIFDTADEGDLQALASDHPALEFLKEGELQWPLFTVPAIPEKPKPWDFEVGHADRSPLKELDYTVGITKGLPTNERKEILTEAFLDELPFVHSDEYMKDWGRPGTRRRLWRVAHHLAWLANGRRHIPSLIHAVSDWAADLAMLKKEFFKPWMRFKWPTVTVPGSRRRR